MNQRCVASCVIVCWTIAANAEVVPPGPVIEQIEPRAYGWFVGDTFERQLIVTAPEGLVIDQESLPHPQRLGQAIELRGVRMQQQRDGQTTRHLINLRYQIFLSPTAVRTLEIAPFVLKLRHGTTEQGLRVEGWPISVAPLVPETVSPRRGLGEMQPDAPLPSVDTGPALLRLTVLMLAALPALAYLAWAWWLGPWWARRQRPFHASWRELQGLPATELLQAWRTVHRALDVSAGHALFEHDLDAWLAARPDAGGLRSDLHRFFQRSRELFFTETPTVNSPADHAWLLQLARRLRALERGR